MVIPVSKVVGLSYAHYPEAKGAQYKGFSEHPESIVWAMIIKHELEKQGYTVVVAPVGRLPQKVAWLNKQNPEVSIEVHFNGSSNAAVNGCETLFYPGSKKGRALAAVVHNRYSKKMGNNNRGVKEGWYRMDVPDQIDFDGDINGDERPDYFLERTNCPALIIEPEFISRIHNITTKRCEAATAIALGIMEYIEA